jgi:DNA-binding transcriptional regulator YhcF (GntR family)
MYTVQDYSKIENNSKIPKYQQLVNSLISDIDMGKLTAGQRLPSINETSEECLLSRDTVERAYTELHRIGVITSVFRKGYFISERDPSKSKTKVFFLVGEVTDSAKSFYNSFVNNTGKNVVSDLCTYNYKAENFKDAINSNLGNYHYYVIMPHQIEENEETIKHLKKISGEKLLLIDKQYESLSNSYSSISYNPEEEMERVMGNCTQNFKKYNTINLVLSSREYFHSEMITGFRNFCEKNDLEYQILDDMVDENLESGHAYLCMDDFDLVDIIKKVKSEKAELGQEVGLVSFNDTCYNEVMANGITVMSCNPIKIGKMAADNVVYNKRGHFYMPMELIMRQSL